MDLFKNIAAQFDDKDDDEKADLHKVVNNGVHPPQESDIHEAKAVHDKVYGQGDKSGVTDEDLGKAAGVQAFTAFERSESSGESDGGGQSKLVQMAMAEAMKMFSGGGGAASGGDKSTVVQSAIAMAMKLFMGKSGAGGGGVGQLMAMLGGGGGGQGGSGGAMDMLGGLAQNPQVSSMLKKFM